MYWYNFTDEEIEELDKAAKNEPLTRLKCRCCLKTDSYKVTKDTKIENIRCKNINCFIKGCLE